MMDDKELSLSRKDFESYRNQVKISIRTNRMALMSDKILLKWLDEIISKFPEEKKEKAKV